MIVSMLQITSRTLLLQSRAKYPEISPLGAHIWSSRQRKTENYPRPYIVTLKRDYGAFEVIEIASLTADKRLWKDLVVSRLQATK